MGGRRYRRTYKTERLGALSDGIFAIVLTLLVLELQLPIAVNVEDEVHEALLANGHELVGWLVSFIVLARMWMIQHDTFGDLRIVSARTIVINFVFLATISLVPFAAKFVGTYEFSNPPAVMVFSVMLGITGLALGWVVWSADKDAMSLSSRSTSWRPRVLHHLLVVPAVSVVAILLTLLHPALAMAVLGAEAIVAVVLLFISDGAEDDAQTDTAITASP